MFSKLSDWLRYQYNKIVTSNDSTYLDIINTLERQVEELQSEEQNYKGIINGKNKLIEDYMLLIEDRDSNIKDLQLALYLAKPSFEEQETEEFWNTKYNQATITYPGRSYPFSNKAIYAPINVLVTPNDPRVISDLKAWGLYRTGEDPETLVPKIYKKVYNTYYKYIFDKDVWGVNEVWEFPFEMFCKIDEQAKLGNKAGFDCDSWGCLLASYYIASGVRRWRVRCVAGDTSIGGHYTNHIFSMEDYKWHHLNSTYGGTLKNKISEYPLNSDAKDPVTKVGKDIIGIYRVWFSFNDLYMWYSKVDDVPKELQVIKVK